ncbi:UNVERIFIED_CONTAM: hypothetical protein Slati_4590000 [Sesamum latifolium]|uniref:Uncharacterized protein n=1 Tax=Sesamum latifolium TaxID=2727402 RepID=A0AAW2S2A3_9LAMI
MGFLPVKAGRVLYEHLRSRLETLGGRRCKPVATIVRNPYHLRRVVDRFDHCPDDCSLVAPEVHKRNWAPCQVFCAIGRNNIVEVDANYESCPTSIDEVLFCHSASYSDSEGLQANNRYGPMVLDRPTGQRESGECVTPLLHTGIEGAREAEYIHSFAIMCNAYVPKPRLTVSMTRESAVGLWRAVVRTGAGFPLIALVVVEREMVEIISLVYFYLGSNLIVGCTRK